MSDSNIGCDACGDDKNLHYNDHLDGVYCEECLNNFFECKEKPKKSDKSNDNE